MDAIDERADPKPCQTCGRLFPKKRNETFAYWDRKRFCSKPCWWKASRVERRQGQITTKGAAFRWSARNYLEDWCVVCGWNETSCDVAHIDRGIDELDNVVMLCPNHHRMYDRGLIPRDEILGLKEGLIPAGSGLI